MRLSDFSPYRTAGRIIAAAVITLGFSFGLASTAGAAGSITIYKNSLKSADGRLEVRQFGSGNCKRGGSSTAFRTRVGKSTRECFYRLPTVGRDLEVTATARIFKATPKKVRPRVYAAVNLRQARDGSRYQLSYYPSGRRFHLKKVLDSGRVLNLANGKVGRQGKGFNDANRLTLRAYNDIAGQPSGSARLVAVINGKRVSVVDDPRGNLLEGRDSTFSIGSKRGSNGALGSFRGIVMRLPNPF
ncbi:MAG: hypothetical protein M3Y23_02390 [Actinomycetota bacterium]|nr:hypothetical protein [Actinomycetota bacterium]